MKSAVTLRFYAELNDFLADQGPTVTMEAKGGERVGDLIAACGVSLEQVDLIVVDGQSIDFDYAVSTGDRIGVYPVFEAFDIEPAVRIRPRPLRVSRLLVDSGLEALAALLVERGVDAEARGDRSLPAMVEAAAASHRIILTREPAVLASEKVSHGYLVRSTDPVEQLDEVLGRLQL